jgi:hypothetical protein
MAEQPIALAFTELTKGEASQWGQAGMIYGYTAASAVLSNTANNLTSYFIGYTSTNTSIPRNHFSGKKIYAGINISVAYADVNAVLLFEGSYDGTNWFTIATMDSDTTPNVTGVQMTQVDLTSIHVPYYRLNFNSSGLNCGTDGKLAFLYCIPAPDGI